MTELITLNIDGKSVNVPPGTTILKAAQFVGISIPTICFHDYCTSNALCRICVVEVKGARTLLAACVAQVSAGMEVTTSNERVKRTRRTILEMLDASVDLSEADDIQVMMQEYGTSSTRFPDAETRRPPILDDNPMYIRDYAKCILCWRCIQVCAEDAQYTYAINFSGRGYHTQVDTYYHKPMLETTCVFCGQCVGVCPTNALKPKRQMLIEQGYTTDEIMNLTRKDRKKKNRGAQQAVDQPAGGQE
jgi:NADH dehydrogenase/NADH:ubiquinone oxidoreductase subunit G